jgi:hypothetical protein
MKSAAMVHEVAAISTSENAGGAEMP